MVSGVPIEKVSATYRYENVAADKEFSTEFEVAEGTMLSRRTYEVTDPRSGHRLTFSISYIPLRLIEKNPDLLDESNEPWPGGHQHQLYTVGIEIDRFVRSVVAESPTAGDRQLWGMEDGVPMLRVRSRSIDIGGRVVELSDAWYPADRTELAFVEQLDRWPDDYARYELAKGDH